MTIAEIRALGLMEEAVAELSGGDDKAELSVQAWFARFAAWRRPSGTVRPRTSMSAWIATTFGKNNWATQSVICST